MTDKIKSIKISYEEFIDINFKAPSKFYILNAAGEYHFVCTNSREAAQMVIDEEYSFNKYKVRCMTIEKTKSKLESGDLSCRGTSTRRGQKK